MNKKNHHLHVQRGYYLDPTRILWHVAVLLVSMQGVFAFTLTTCQRDMSTKFEAQMTTFSSAKHTGRSHVTTRGSLHMKDASASYWFKVGDKVQVSSPVTKAGIELKGKIGEVIETWEKCDVDPTCCCAEFVDENFAVTVKFEGKVDPNTAEDSKEEFVKGINTSSSFTHYFNEDELLKLEDEDAQLPPVVAFDGMSCRAFKLDQLKMGKQAQRIASFEASRSEED
mmetsp:Transcript_34540/g.98219  ORF Transcript_34540/g.98219 Transcript_34540/m.98219 type:complete len:226 (-) Transcript_34540:31-708(-)